MADASATHGLAVHMPEAKLEPDAIGVTQDTVIGMASSAPAVSVGLSLAALGGRHGLWQRCDHHPDGDPHADYRQRLPAAQYVERQLRSQL